METQTQIEPAAADQPTPAPAPQTTDRLAEAEQALNDALETLQFAWAALREAALERKLSDGYTTLELALTGGSKGAPMRFQCSVYYDTGASTWGHLNPAALVAGIRQMDPARKAQIASLTAQLEALKKGGHQ